MYSGSLKIRGFTLTELMIALALLSILAAIAMPAFDNFTLNSRLRTYSNDFAAAAKLARSEALKRNAPVRMCMSADGATCTNSGSWEQGWLVVTAADEVVRAWPAVVSGYRVTSAVSLLTFQANGLGGGMTALVCRQTPVVGGQERVITVSTLGRTEVAKTATGTCS